jgi:Ca2+-binding RTX toxin-like protein
MPALGNDTVWSGPHDDDIAGGEGSDSLWGGRGHDFIAGGDDGDEPASGGGNRPRTGC